MSIGRGLRSGYASIEDIQPDVGHLCACRGLGCYPLARGVIGVSQYSDGARLPTQWGVNYETLVGTVAWL